MFFVWGLWNYSPVGLGKAQGITLFFFYVFTFSKVSFSQLYFSLDQRAQQEQREGSYVINICEMMQYRSGNLNQSIPFVDK
ncbi:hypothetical protein P4278_31530 [Bacillus thuringiensis]|nr:hypothetical protein [Bacillus thuringiensis]MED2784130.1 hypothetical protein [Bacillus thuringiensis]